MADGKGTGRQDLSRELLPAIAPTTIILLHHLDYCCSSLQHWRFRNKSPRRCIVHFWGLPNGQPGVSNSSSDPPHEEGCAIYRLMIMGKASFLPGKGEPGCRPRPTS